MFIFESVGGELFFYFMTLCWFCLMPKRSAFMVALVYFGADGQTFAECASVWAILMTLMLFTYPKFLIPFLVGFGLGSGKIQDWLRRRVL